MASGTKIRTFSRLLDASCASVWVIGPDGRLNYLSGGCGRWLGFDVEALIDRRCVAGSPVSDDLADRIAAALSPPSEIRQRGTASMRIHPPAVGDHRPEVREARFVRAGEGEQVMTIGVAGRFEDRESDVDLHEAVAMRQRLDAWRRRHAGLAAIASAGVTPSARRTRRRIEVASALRTDVGFFGPQGCGGESIARRVHDRSAPGETLVVIDGPLMDPELLDATMAPLVHLLSDSSESLGSALIRGLDEMPLDAQQRLVQLAGPYDGRLRLIGLCGSRPPALDEGVDSAVQPNPGDVLPEPMVGLCSDLIERLSALTVQCIPLAARVEDVPLIATALLDDRLARGETAAERFSRSALDALSVYPWPGDFEELTHCVRHASQSTTAATIAVEHLPLAIRSYRCGQTAGPASPSTISLDDALQRLELKLIREALDAAGGNRAEAARRLEISRARLLRRLDDTKEGE